MKTKPVLAAIVAGGFLMSFCLPTQAGAIYRWVDERGQTQFTDTVPDQHKKSAVKIDARKFKVTREQRKEAEARANLEQRREAEARAVRERRGAADTASPTAKSGITVAQSTPAPDNSCPARIKRFRDSEACFSSYKTVWGIKAEAFQKCPQVENPILECIGGKRLEWEIPPNARRDESHFYGRERDSSTVATTR